MGFSENAVYHGIPPNKSFNGENDREALDFGPPTNESRATHTDLPRYGPVWAKAIVSLPTYKCQLQQEHGPGMFR